MKFEKFSNPVDQPQESNGIEASEEKTREASADHLDIVRRGINRIVESKRTRNEELGYDSTVGVYGAKLKKDAEGNLVWDNRDLASKFDRWGDRLLRAFDEHQVKDPVAMAERHPRALLHMLPFASDPKRFRGNAEQIMENVRRLGLEEYYGAHPDGVEIKNPEIYSKGVNLQDIFHADQINSPELEKIDRFAAAESAGKYLGEIHSKHGAVGEMLGNDIIFMEQAEGAVHKPILNLPDEVYNPEKNIGDKEKMGTDLLDFLASVGAEEWRRSDDWGNVEKVLDCILVDYGNRPVVEMVESFARRGRLVLPGESDIDETLSLTARVFKKGFQLHNVERLKVASEMTANLRRAIIGGCEKALASQDGFSASKEEVK